MRPSLASAALVVAYGSMAPAAGAAPVVLDDGHADYAARIVGGELRSEVKDGTTTPATWRDPAEVEFRLTETARETVPEGFGFLGPAGSSTWLVPQVQRAGVVWLGWNTEAATAAVEPLSWTLDAVEGPGRVAVFVNDALGRPSVLFDSSDGLPDTHRVPAGTHAHGNWAFSSRGTYRLTFTHRTRTAAATLADTATITVVVDPPVHGDAPGGPAAPSGPGDGSAATGSAGAGGSGRPPAPGTPAAAGRAAQVTTTWARLRTDGTIRVRVVCRRGAGSCTGRVELRTVAAFRRDRTRRRLRLGSAPYRIAAGQRSTVPVRVPAAAAGLLRSPLIAARAVTREPAAATSATSTFRLQIPKR